MVVYLAFWIGIAPNPFGIIVLLAPNEIFVFLGSVAQLAEHRADNAKVTGSFPVTSIKGYIYIFSDI